MSLPGSWAALPGAAAFEEDLFRSLNLAGSDPLLDAILYAFTVLGTAYVIALLAAPLAWRGQRELAFDVLVLVAVALVVTEALKLATGRPRPCEALVSVRTLAWYPCGSEPGLAFPSGHATRAFALAALLAGRLGARPGLALGSVAALIGLSRVYLGVHWPTDVIGGAVLGLALGAAALVVERRSSGYRALRGRILKGLERIVRRRPHA